jgi:2-isopropylmalate synthase
MTDRVFIFDTTLRDGEQSPGCSMTVPEKVRMAHKLVELGVDILEAGFPIASEGDFEAVDAVSREFPWVQVAALARACTKDIERAARALEHARRPRIHTFIATSDIHLKHKLRKTREQVFDDAVAAVELARRYADDVEFSAEDATRSDLDYLEQVCKAVVAAGARTVNLPTQSATPFPRNTGNSSDGSRGCWGIRPSSACIATTTSALRRRTRLPACRRARGRSSAPSTVSGSGPETARSKRWSWR